MPSTTSTKQSKTSSSQSGNGNTPWLTDDFQGQAIWKSYRRDEVVTITSLSGTDTSNKRYFNTNLGGVPENQLSQFHRAHLTQTISHVIHWANEARQPLPPIAWLVENLIEMGSIVQLVGDGGVGKTYTMLDLAVRLSMGAADWLGFKVTPCTVLLVDEESGHNRSMRRIRHVMDGHNAPDDIWLAVMTVQNVQLLDSCGQEKLEEAIKHTGAKLIILDAWIDMIAGANDDKASEIQPAYHFLRTMIEKYGCTFIIIDHANKTGGYRGSGAKKGAVDLMLVVERSGDILTFRTEKERDIEKTAFSARMNFSIDGFNLSPTNSPASRPHFSKGEQYVLRYLLAHGGSALLTDIAMAPDTVSSGTAENAARSLSAKGFTKRTDQGGKGAIATYELTFNGREEAQRL